MKKKILILVLALALVLTACGKNKTETKETVEGTKATELMEVTEKPTEEITEVDDSKPTDEEIKIAETFQTRLTEESIKISDKYLKLEVNDENMEAEVNEKEEMEERVTSEVAKELGITIDKLDEIFMKVNAYKYIK